MTPGAEERLDALYQSWARADGWTNWAMVAAEDKDGLTIRLTTRTVGTMCGDLRLRQEIIPPNGQRMICPPEVSLIFSISIRSFLDTFSHTYSRDL